MEGQVFPGSEDVNPIFDTFPFEKMICDDNCCTSSNNVTICFKDYNYTDKMNITHHEPWDVAVRWTYATLVVLVAFLGNLCIIIILLKNRLLLRTSVNLFILNMSVADLITSLAGPIPFTIQQVSYFWPLGRIWCHLEGYILMLVMLVSVTSLATISCDRMVGVVFPFHKHLKRWNYVAIIVAIWVVSAILALPFCFYRIYTVRAWKDLTETNCGEEDQKIRIWWVVSIIGLTWLPLSIMVVSYTRIFVYFQQMRFSFMKSREHPAMVHLKKRVVRMMFVVVVAFTVCWLPFQILKIANNMFIDESGHFVNEKAEQTYNDLLTVAQYMVYTNAAINPIVYALMHQTFRRAFRVTFPCFYKNEPSLVLTRGQGMQRYVWSIKSTASDVYGSDVVYNPPRNLKDRIRGKNHLTPSALLSSAAVAASIALDPKSKKARTVSESSSQRSRSGSGRDSGRGSFSESLTELQISYANEGFVMDLQPRRMSFVSTGSLGHLVTQVIEEETSSDVENERVL
ncbi:substance-K receptor-like [Homarus americanus]|uniref:substance-K receptor-like n=1 Tax=Homarus americanus TaxID=6706 RepID=UPI001C4741B7|nr:substance-K receptor-like [Homarus americanus]